MMDLDIDEVLASANSLLSSLYEDLQFSPTRSTRRNRSSLSLTVSPEAQREIDQIDRYIQEIPSATVPPEGSENQTEESLQIINVALPTPEPAANQYDDVQIISPPAVPPRPITQRRSRRRSVLQVGPEDVIDLCSDTERNRSLARPSPSESVEVINLVSPAVNVRRSRGSDPPTVYAIVNDEDNQENKSCSPNKTTVENMCAICMEPYISHQPVATKCGHIFCRPCIHQALQQQNKCPICRSRITTRTLLRLHF